MARGKYKRKLADLVTYSEKELATLPGVGKVALEGIVEAVQQHGAHLKDE